MNFFWPIAGAGILSGIIFAVWMLRRKHQYHDALTGVKPVRTARTIDVGPHPMQARNHDTGTSEAALNARLRDATTLEDCMTIYYDASSSLIEKAASEKFFSLASAQLESATSLEDCLDFLRALPDCYGYGGPIRARSDPLIGVAVIKALSLATTFDDVQAVDEFTPPDSELEKQCIQRYLDLCETIYDAELIWDEHDVDSEYGRMAILRAAELIQAGKPYE